MAKIAAKREKARVCWPLLVSIVVFAATMLGSPAAEASRYLPSTLTAAQELGQAALDRVDVFEIDDESLALFTDEDFFLLAAVSDLEETERAQVLADLRFRLFPSSAPLPCRLEPIADWRPASGDYFSGIECNLWENRGLGLDSWWTSDLYAFVGWGPHMGTDPMGLCLGFNDMSCSEVAEGIIAGMDSRIDAQPMGGTGFKGGQKVAARVITFPVTAVLNLGAGTGKMYGRGEGLVQGHVPNIRTEEELRQEINEFTFDALEFGGDVAVVAPFARQFSTGTKALVNEVLAVRTTARESSSIFKPVPVTTDVMGSEMLDDSLRMVEQPLSPRKTPQVQLNRAAGDEWSEAVGEELKATYEVVVPEITVKTQTGVKTRLDWVTKDTVGEIACVECKASATARFTKNQKLAFPEIVESGAVVVGKGKPGVPGGTIIPPVTVKVRRP